MNEFDLVVGNSYYNRRDCNLYRYEGVHASTFISTVHEFTELVEEYNEDFNVTVYFWVPRYIDSVQDAQFIKDLCIY